MRIPLDRHDSTPLYQQIERYLRHLILAGTLAPATRLPAARQLADALTVSRITVENAYATLEADGLVERRSGSGTYVLAPDTFHQPAPGGDWPLWQHTLHAALETEQPFAEREARGTHPNPIAFTGFGDPRRFPLRDFAAALKAVLRRDGVAALGLEEGRGYGPLRTTIAHILANQGVQTQPDAVLVTAGSQQALALVTQLLLKPGDSVLVENPTYDGALDLFRAHGLRLVGCPCDAMGMQVELLEPLLQRQHPRLIYTIPNFQNPTGVCLSLARRRQLLALAERYNVPILEDDFVGDLRYEGRAQPALKALDPGGRVIYVGTFSKLLMPGLRVGFVVADGPISALLLERKRVSDLATATLVQRALEQYVTVGRYHAYLRRSCQVYRRRRDALIAAVEQHMPPGTHVVAPQGGIFAWLRLPDGASSLQLLPLAAEEGVAYAPGPRFCVEPSAGEPHLRLNFATLTPAEIDEGVRRLARALRRLQA